MIADGVLPSNEGRGYVLRRLLRRSARHGRLIGIEKPFLNGLCKKVVESSEAAYPELTDKYEHIKRVIKNEERAFASTVERGLELLNKYISENESGEIDGEAVFKLHDTYGFPVDLTREILAENDLSFDEDKFKELMTQQKDTARANQSFKGGWNQESAFVDISWIEQEYVGDNTTKLNTVVTEIIRSGEEVMVILEKTPFYAESGGQTGDTGTIENENCILKVKDTKKSANGLSVCHCSLEKGEINPGDKVTAMINTIRRDYTTRNHTAAHLLQSALRAVLGEHVQQAGSLVDEDRCRFDFTHTEALTAEQIQIVEGYVNEAILEDIAVNISRMNIDEAREMGAIALFGEKYGDRVRVVDISNNIYNISTELCGGTHVKNTGQLGLFKIMSESSVAAGVRRIEAVTGAGVLELLESSKREVAECQEKIRQLNSAHAKEIARLNAVIAELQASSAEIFELDEVDGIHLYVQEIPGADAGAIRQAGDYIKESYDNFAAVIAGESNFYCVCDDNATSKKFHAGNIVREIAAVTGGKGGGKADSAMAGIGDASKINEALESLPEIVKKLR
jgi:alanyl-tRNA synthetase